jgi:tetratricopeptide (TPR) repeat protein
VPALLRAGEQAASQPKGKEAAKSGAQSPETERAGPGAKTAPKAGVASAVVKSVLEALAGEPGPVGHRPDPLRQRPDPLWDWLDREDLKPAKPATAYERGKQEFEGGRYQDAVKSFDQAIAEGPKDKRAFRCRAFAGLLAGDLQGAIRDFTTAAQIDRRDAVAFYGRGAVRELLGEDEQALADLTEAIRLNPKYGAAYLLRSGLWIRLHEFEKNASDMKRAMEIRNDWNEARDIESGKCVDLNRFLAYRYWQVLYEEHRDLEKGGSVRLALGGPIPAQAMPHVKLALQQVTARELDKAVESLDQAIRAAPKHATAHGLRGAVHVVQGDLKAALADYTRACELKPDEIMLQIERDEISFEIQHGETMARLRRMPRALRGLPAAPPKKP